MKDASLNNFGLLIAYLLPGFTVIIAIDEVREELQWLTRNGLPSREPLTATPVLKQMAADPCAERNALPRRGAVPRS